MGVVAVAVLKVLNLVVADSIKSFDFAVEVENENILISSGFAVPILASIVEGNEVIVRDAITLGDRVLQVGCLADVFTPIFVDALTKS